MKLVLATGNRDKVAEIVRILAGLDIDIVDPREFPDMPDVVEDGDTLEANAVKKAREIRDFTGMCALADDTGLEVAALDGAPGVYSSRYAGEDVTYDDNNRKLLADMASVPDDRRSAAFRCVMALALTPEVAASAAGGDAGDTSPAADTTTAGSVDSGGDAGSDDSRRTNDVLCTEGALHGSITREKRGEGGFGFDPVFEVGGRTLAEMDVDEKNQISHRYRALVEMRELLIRCGLAREAE